MSVIAAAVKYLLAAGMPHDEVIRAIEEMEAATVKAMADFQRGSSPARSKHAESQARYEAKKRARRDAETAIEVVTSDQNDQNDHAPPSLDKESPPDPLKKLNPYPPNPPSGGIPPTPKAKREGKRATRLAPDWRPTSKNREDATALGLTEADIERIWPRFRDHWLAVPGQKGVKLDWDATWRNWCGKDAERLGRAPPNVGGAAAVGGQVHVMRESDEWPIWAERYRRHKGKDPPIDRLGGWTFEAKWAEIQEAAE